VIRSASRELKPIAGPVTVEVAQLRPGRLVIVSGDVRAMPLLEGLAIAVARQERLPPHHRQRREGRAPLLDRGRRVARRDPHGLEREARRRGGRHPLGRPVGGNLRAGGDIEAAHGIVASMAGMTFAVDGKPLVEKGVLRTTPGVMWSCDGGPRAGSPSRRASRSGRAG
jgi:hypothetical protein